MFGVQPARKSGSSVASARISKSLVSSHIQSYPNFAPLGSPSQGTQFDQPLASRSTARHPAFDSASTTVDFPVPDSEFKQLMNRFHPAKGK